MGKVNEYGDLICECGNEPSIYGFYPCDIHGEEMEPLIGSDWPGLYRCDKCKKILDGETGKEVPLIP